MTLSILILAAGKGKRMGTDLPKVLHTLGGRTLLERVVATAESLHPAAIYIVYGNGGSQVREELAHLNVTWIEQPQILGTGHAVSCALPYLPEKTEVLVLYADVPLILKNTLTRLLEVAPKNALTLLVATLPDPTGFGRIIRDTAEHITAIVEQKDATLAQQNIQEINTGIFATTAARLRQWIPALRPINAQKEYYLTDIVAIAVENTLSVGSVKVEDISEIRGINSLAELAQLERSYQLTLANQLMQKGVRIADPLRLDIRGEASIASGVCIDVNVILSGQISIGENTSIGPHCTLRDVKIGNRVHIASHVVIEGAILEDDCIIGPFAHIRPGSRIGRGAKIGNFVEIKNTELGTESKVPHLSYIGDATIGEKVNFGAGTLTVNYDGIEKHRTYVKNHAFIGCGTQLIAPLTVGERAYIGAGSTITTDAPPDQLTLSRVKQRSISGWKKKKRSS